MESDVVEAVAKHIPLEYTDVTAAFASCESRMVSDGLTEGYNAGASIERICWEDRFENLRR